MKVCIKSYIKDSIDFMYSRMRLLMAKLSKGQQQWLWFVALWLVGFFSVLSISMVIKLIMKL